MRTRVAPRPGRGRSCHRLTSTPNGRLYALQHAIPNPSSPARRGENEIMVIASFTQKGQWVEYEDSNVGDIQMHYLGTGTGTYRRETISHTSDRTRRRHIVRLWLETENRDDA